MAVVHDARPAEDAGNIQLRIAAAAAQRALGAAKPSDVTVEPLACNYFSYTFAMSCASEGKIIRLFVKIPKEDLRLRPRGILPLTPGDLRMGEEEEASLRRLAETWPSGGNVRWVELEAFLPEHNAVVTRRVDAEDAFAVFRRWDLERRRGASESSSRLCDAMRRIGESLGIHHRAHARPASVSPTEMREKLERYAGELSATGCGILCEIPRRLQSLPDEPLPSFLVPTLKGLDIRNVLIDGGGLIHLLDPGKTKVTHREADLARFLMTYRILHWGSAWLPVMGEPDPAAREAFLEAYDPGRTVSSKLLALYEIKELLKHWGTALDSVGKREWSPAAKRLATAAYVNPFYARLLRRQLRTLSDMAAA